MSHGCPPNASRPDVPRSAQDVLAEVLRIERCGMIRPLWRDLPDDDRKRAWRHRAAWLLKALGRRGFALHREDDPS